MCSFAFFRKVNTSSVAEKSLDERARCRCQLCSVAVAGTAPVRSGQRGDLDLWKQNPEAYWKVMDQMMDALQARGIKIVPVFVWNLGQFPSMNDEGQVDALLTNPNSRSWKLLGSYISEFAMRYRNYAGILFYELGNEFNLPADLDVNRRCETAKFLMCGAKANFSSGRI